MMYKLYFFDLFFYKKIKKKEGLKVQKKSSKGVIKSSKEKFKRKVQKEGLKVQKKSSKGGIKREPWFPLWVAKTDSWKDRQFPIDCLVPFASLPSYLSWMCPHP